MKPEDKKQFTFLSDVEETDIDWLWRGWFELGTVSIVGGMPGTGKSTVLSDIAARVTKGALMPDGTKCETPGGVIVISYEEKTASKIVPRLRQQDADLSKIIDLSKVKRTVYRPGDRSSTPFALPDDLPSLKKAIKACHASLVIIDPLMSMAAANKRIYGNQAAREVVGALQDLAEEMGVAVVILNHFTKGNLKDPLRSMAGSQGFIDFVRTVVMMSKDEAEPEHVIMSLLKHSNAGEAPQVVCQHNGIHVTYLEGVTLEQEAKHEKQVAKTNEENTVALLKATPKKTFTPTEVCQELDISYDTAKSVLRRAADKGLIARTQHGHYKAA